ncbi:MAG: hypothetical protein JSS04_20440 [Proteobacteria bacterium]|nr:hypothetical protein [Pseudomonadota bacterium]
MLKANRRSTLKLLGGAALTAGVLPSLVLPAAAQQDPYVASTYQNFKRGKINSMHPEVRSFTIIWDDLGRVKLKASDLVANEGSSGVGNAYAQLKPGQTVDVQWYDYVDFLIAPKTDASMAQAKALVNQGARIEGIPGAKTRIKLWEMDGMVTKVDPANSQIFLIYKSGGEPEHPSPNAGEVIQMPRIVSPAGKAAMASLKPGDEVVTVYSQQTALNVKIIR